MRAAAIALLGAAPAMAEDATDTQAAAAKPVATVPAATAPAASSPPINAPASALDFDVAGMAPAASVPPPAPLAQPVTARLVVSQFLDTPVAGDARETLRYGG
ncbi:MAG TPA: hypothetical protein VFX62_06075, partial [Erythrobacter sp.]|nr:hypothetical protein [Erythrobacter sp.]